MLAALCALSACAIDRGTTTQSTIAAAVDQAEQSPAKQMQPFAVPPQPQPAPLPAAGERFDVDVVNTAARDFFRSLVAGTNQNIVIDPNVKGRITLHLKQVTLPEVLETVSQVYGYGYRRTAVGFVILPATLQSKVFEVDYLNLVRTGRSRTRVSSGQVSQSSGSDRNRVQALDGAVAVGNGNDREGEQTTGSVIDTINNNDFWAALKTTLQSILGTGEGRQVVVDAQAGVVFARGMPNELRAVGEYLDQIRDSAQREVVLEAKIIEVTLNDDSQAGVNWSAVGVNSQGDTLSGGVLSGGDQIDHSLPLNGGRPLTIGPGNPVTSFPSQTVGGAFAMAFDIGDFNAFVELLSRQGDTRVLSSPRVATLNNQKAVIKAGTDEFFVTDVSSDTVTGTAATTSRDVTLTPFFSGIALDVTPEISADGEVILHIHPTVSDVTDQTKELTISGQTDQLPLAMSEVRESDSIVKAKSGQIIAIGGLMRNSSHKIDFSTPGLRRIPGLKRLFGSTRNVETKTELIILLRPIVVDDDADWPKIIQPAVQRLGALNQAGQAGSAANGK
ncbi:MAG TPA: pilus (MSHA type) biogenesis protein MshL [Gammaproteobacteria bacterium]|nr:pilus (MSHA type) biogenesis protein MshL [Gammaproteobacteria bacterium]